jgi:hypothetical protein
LAFFDVRHMRGGTMQARGKCAGGRYRDRFERGVGRDDAAVGAGVRAAISFGSWPGISRRVVTGACASDDRDAAA